MTERSLYAWAGTLICWSLLQAGIAAGQAPSSPACAACIAITLAPAQALLLPEELHGLTVLLRASGASPEGLRLALDEVKVRGGRPGILVTGEEGVTAERRAYALKLRLTELRAVMGADLLIALQMPADAELAGYADVLVGRSADGIPGATLWPLLEGTDLTRALAATTRGGAAQWVMAVPADVIEARQLLHALARAASPDPEVFTEAVEVRGSRLLTVGEIIARHQAFARRQAGRVTRTISTGVLTLTFEAPGFPAPVTITSETVIYASPERTELEQRGVRVNGIAFQGGGVPRLPILEPERVASPPLAITLTNLYRYRLVEQAAVNGVPCYVVAFEPLDSGATLFRGRAWIAVDSFAMVRVAAAQTRLRGAIVSSEQVDDFGESRPGIWLLARSNVRQIYEGAAHRTPIQRLLTITSHEIDPPGFAERLQAAYASPSIMLRDTPDGYRYLKRERLARPEAPGSAPVIVTEVAQRSERVRTLAAGVIVDPNISVPLPFAGLSYVDFNLLGTGAQLNAFFGGSYAQLAFSAPSLGGSRWQLAGRAFGIASSYHDRSFRSGHEIYEENLRQRPAHASVWLLRPLSPRLTIRAGYEFDYTRLQAADETAASFVVPADQRVHGARVALEGQRAGWAGSVWWNPAWRTGWRPWGRTAADYSAGHASFHRYGVSASRSTALTSRVVTRVEAVAMAGSELDRFSRYAFGTFDNRLRGYPSALVRYDRGGVVRGAIAWSMSRFARLDGFLDTALVQDRGFGRGYRNYTGLGAAVEAPAPFGLLTAVEWGYGFRGVNADGRQGTHVIRLSAYKVF
ncbi:MAG TPA: hypothetical protein VJ813_01965 [Vicinamibacterales bacterium]|nr:hypothetical protein [Vicinamibacterales bacterium]